MIIVRLETSLKNLEFLKGWSDRQPILLSCGSVFIDDEDKISYGARLQCWGYGCFYIYEYDIENGVFDTKDIVDKKSKVAELKILMIEKAVKVLSDIGITNYLFGDIIESNDMP